MLDPAKQLTVVIPAYNEERSIAAVINDVFTQCANFVAEIIVVDDGSTDGTSAVVKATPARLIHHSQNRGYGAALKTGIKAAQTEFVATMDSDGQHNAQSVKLLWESRAEHDMVVGARSALLHSPMWRMPGKWLIGVMANYLTKRRIPDLNSGLRIIRGSTALKYIHICPDGYSFSTTITVALLTRGYSVGYVPIQVTRRVGKSQVSLTTGFSTIILILRLATLFDPLRIYLPTSFLIGLIGVLWGIPYAVTGHGVSVGAMLALVTAIVLFSVGLLSDQISQLRLERFE